MKELEGLLELPELVRRSLDDWRHAVKKVMRDKLVGIVVYGSAARGEYDVRTSDLDVALVLRGATSEDLRALRHPLRVGRIAAHIEPLILDADEIPRMAEVFPLYYEAILRHRVVIQGKDPFAGLEPPTEHVELRLEQELRDARVRLRRVAVDTNGDALRTALDRKLRQLREPLFALLERQKIPCANDGLDAVMQSACKHWNVPLREIRSPDADRAHAALSLLVERALGDVEET